MQTGLICSENLKMVMLELLTARNIGLDDQSEICIVESGHEIPGGKTAIVFETTNMSGLTTLLDVLSKSGEDLISSIVGRNDEKYQMIQLSQVFYFEGRGNNTYCVTAAGDYRVKEKLYELETRLPQNSFIRVNKSFIVNITNVSEIIPWFGRRLVLRFENSNKEIEVSKNYVKVFKEFLGM